MLSRVELGQLFHLNPPASPGALAIAEREYGKPLPMDYVEFLQVSDGLNTDGNLAILEVEVVVQRNADYEVQACLPDYFMIGDDGGGIAILIKDGDRRIFEVPMGVMDEESMRLSANSLKDLLINHRGKPLVERGGW